MLPRVAFQDIVVLDSRAVGIGEQPVHVPVGAAAVKPSAVCPEEGKALEMGCSRPLHRERGVLTQEELSPTLEAGIPLRLEVDAVPLAADLLVGFSVGQPSSGLGSCRALWSICQRASV